MNALILLYRTFLYPFIKFLAHFLSAKNPKLREGIESREPKNGNYPWLNFEKNSKPIWIHCASGEFEYAKPLIQEIKKNHPDQKIMVTYFSPSIKTSIQKYSLVDFSSPSPWDEPHFLSEMIKFHRPKILLISRTDLWLEMLLQCKIHQVPSILFSATLTPHSKRMKNFITRWYYKNLCTLLTEIYCVTEDDKNQFCRLGAKEKTLVSGDTRFDQVLERLNHPKELKNELKPTLKTFIAGSTWPEDEKVLFQCIEKLHKQNICTLLVPHEPTVSHMKEIESHLISQNIPFQKYSTATEFTKGVLIIDQIGILAELYQWANVAFVGGSFKKTVHSVMEPLASGLPVVLGPFVENNREASYFATKLTQNLPIVCICRSQLELQLALENAFKAPQELIRSDIIKEVTKLTGATKRLYEHIRPLLNVSK